MSIVEFTKGESKTFLNPEINNSDNYDKLNCVIKNGCGIINNKWYYNKI
ncbi:MAG: hypothetical protein Q8880_02540 [Bacteroidota bacterium]|nr:hypothetical protein [Bacteroidota bacterium]